MLRHLVPTVASMQTSTRSSTHDDDVPQQDDLVVLGLEVAIVVTFVAIIGIAALWLT